MFYENSDNFLYYGRFKGSFNKIRIFSWIIFHPGRLLNLLKFGQLIKNNKIRKRKFIKIVNSETFKNKKNLNSEYLIYKFDEYCKNGGVILENFFSSSVVDQFLNKYDYITKNYCKKFDAENLNDIQSKISSNIVGAEYLPISDELKELWLNDIVISFIRSAHGQKIGKNIYARNYPVMVFANVINQNIGSRNDHDDMLMGRKNINQGAYFWHADHSVIISVHILMDDINEENPHMEFIPVRRNFLTMATNYSDEIIKSKKKEAIKCIGKKGTVYIHAGSTIHRLKVKKGSRRVLHFEFTAGSNILFDAANMTKCLKYDFDLENLNSSDRDVLKGIFPKTLFKGFEINDNDILRPTKFRGV